MKNENNVQNANQMGKKMIWIESSLQVIPNKRTILGSMVCFGISSEIPNF